MRDYFIHPAQTNLELYEQVISHRYTQAERRRVAQAYQFAFRQVFPLARGSGKPFISHLVGTASLVLESGCPDDWVIAALLHALYQRRVPFIDGLAPANRRAVVAKRFGRDVDDLVHRYTAVDGRSPAEAKIEFDADADVVTLLLADELEDLSGHAIALHGRSSPDDPPVQGSYSWRRARKTIQGAGLLDAASALGLGGIRRGLSHWLDFAAVPESLSDMETGWFSSVDLSCIGSLDL